MYNRYIRNDNGTYTRIPEESPQEDRRQTSPNMGSGQSQAHDHGQQSQERRQAPPQNERPEMGGPDRTSAPGGRSSDGLSGFLRHILDQLHLDHVDTGDLLLLVLLFFLFREDADEELLVALGLLLIL